MLSSLLIKNYAIISELEIHFDKGFSVITGETGAGKSIIMGALSLVLGQRADAKMIRSGAEKCLIEVCFDIAEYHLSDFFEENDLDYDEQSIIRREILSNGKSRAFINDVPVSLSILKEFSEKLIDIHSQHENLLLKDYSFQLSVVDAIAQNSEMLQSFQTVFRKYKKLQQTLAELIDFNAKNKAEQDYISFQLEQLKNAKLIENEQSELEEEQNKLTHSEEIKTELGKVSHLLADENSGANLQLKEAVSSLRKITKYIDSLSETESRLYSCLIDVKDISEEIESLQNAVEFDPQRAEFIAQRLDLIYSLQQKHQVHSIDELLDLQTQWEEKLTRIECSEDEVKALQQEIEDTEKLAFQWAAKLSESRKISGKSIAKNLTGHLQQLGMPKVRMEVAISPKNELTINGTDQIDFLFSANEKAALQPIAHIASGGEISRVMLGIKALLASVKTLPTIIFDEIDSGISGEVAHKMANIMAKMSQNMQVICITHLPQIAAKGKQHYSVYKQDSESNIRRLSQEERIAEIAQMLSGARLSDAAIENAKSLLTTN